MLILFDNKRITYQERSRRVCVIPLDIQLWKSFVRNTVVAGHDSRVAGHNVRWHWQWLYLQTTRLRSQTETEKQQEQEHVVSRHDQREFCHTSALTEGWDTTEWDSPLTLSPGCRVWSCCRHQVHRNFGAKSKQTFNHQLQIVIKLILKVKTSVC